MNICVGHLAVTVTAQDLRELFAPYGVVDRITLLRIARPVARVGLALSQRRMTRRPKRPLPGSRGQTLLTVPYMSMKPDSAKSAVQGVARVIAVVDAVGSPRAASRSKRPRVRRGGPLDRATSRQNIP